MKSIFFDTYYCYILKILIINNCNYNKKKLELHERFTFLHIISICMKKESNIEMKLKSIDDYSFITQTVHVITWFFQFSPSLFVTIGFFTATRMNCDSNFAWSRSAIASRLNCSFRSISSGINILCLRTQQLIELLWFERESISHRRWCI